MVSSFWRPSSVDTNVNKLGKKYIDFCKLSDLRILDVQTMGNPEGAYTRVQYGGRSNVTLD